MHLPQLYMISICWCVFIRTQGPPYPRFAVCLSVFASSFLVRSIPKPWRLQHCCLDFMCLKNNNVNYPSLIYWLYVHLL